MGTQGMMTLPELLGTKVKIYKTCLCNTEFYCSLRFKGEEKWCKACRNLLLSNLPPSIIIGEGKLWYREEGLNTKIEEILNLKKQIEIGVREESFFWKEFSLIWVPETQFLVTGSWSVTLEPQVGFKGGKRPLGNLLWSRELAVIILPRINSDSITLDEMIELLTLTLPSSSQLLELTKKRLENFESEVLKAKKFFLETELGLYRS